MIKLNKFKIGISARNRKECFVGMSYVENWGCPNYLFFKHIQASNFYFDILEIDRNGKITGTLSFKSKANPDTPIKIDII